MKNQRPKIVFLGTPEFAIKPLVALINAGYEIAGVITAPDKPVGRKQILTPPPIKILAEKYCLPVYQPKDKIELLEIMKEFLQNIPATGRMQIPRWNLLMFQKMQKAWF